MAPSEKTVRYGQSEMQAESEEKFVHVPGVFLAAPPRDLAVQRRTRTTWGRRRYEEWTEKGQQYGCWRWATEGELRQLLADEETQRLRPTPTENGDE